jgi:molybdenum cofactor biosynthesis enzyme
VARAGGRIRMRAATMKQIVAGSAKKGDVLGVARIAAIPPPRFGDRTCTGVRSRSAARA